MEGDCSHAERLQEGPARSQLEIFERYGHLSHQDRSDEFAEMVLALVQSGHQTA